MIASLKNRQSLSRFVLYAPPDRRVLGSPFFFPFGVQMLLVCERENLQSLFMNRPHNFKGTKIACRQIFVRHLYFF